jgi:hypothetical protein
LNEHVIKNLMLSLTITSPQARPWSLHKIRPLNGHVITITSPRVSNALICGPYLPQRFKGEDFMKERFFTPSLTMERDITLMNRYDFPSTLKV